MSCKVLLLAVLTLSVLAFGQAGARPDSAMPQPSSPNATAPSGNRFGVGNSLAWYGGTVGYYGEGAAGGVLLTTPTASFDSPMPTAGISDAGRAGISNFNPVNTSVQSSEGSPTLVYTNIQPEIPATVNPATSAVSAQPQAADYGPSYFSNEGGGRAEAVSSLSLAEIAERYRDAQGTQTVRTYTNASVRPAGNVADAENVLLARNAPPALPQGTAGAGPTETASNRPSSALPQGANGAGQPEQKSQSAQLPASATVLPLLGLVGLMSVGLGLWLKGLSRSRSLARAR